ncbi:MAG TPA: MFS transporter [Chlorobaculum sp.]|uniref:Transporter, putative n=1 Tax=Chlorobaculum tepidum (strain ATCC 49652 / DSM 12025 / NBRC 103806 / TLS) TaxID=194439 RepID=Q8KG66_CHLTE|nr:MFS transporter [Chlorobaculum tepidum]AAM71350.1 transporter, putative [Chlorobaculum tepidum TLS]HBU24360.1 MFS transporter [Chlorobaculum sp.]
MSTVPEEDFSGNHDDSLPLPSGGGLKSKLLAAFPPFASRNFRLYFVGQIVSMIGTWLQMVAQGWLVLEMTGSAFWVGVTAATSTVPTLLLSLFGGMIVDRYSRRTILLWTQALSMMLALILGAITLSGHITIPAILVLAFLLGSVGALATPAIQAFISEMVERKDLPSAVALNASIFNASRVVGPVLAGFMITWVGTGGAFIANGVSYVAVIAALLAIRPTAAPPRPAVEERPIQSIRSGIAYTRRHPVIRAIVLFVGVVSIFGWSFMSMLPVVARQTFGIGAAGMGYLYSAFGLGSLSGTVVVSMTSGKVRADRLVIGGILTFAVALAAFTFATWLPLALFFLYLSGLGMLSAFATMSATVQRLVDDRFRGRVMSIYLMVLLGLMPFGNLLMGLLSEHFGTPAALRTGAMVTIAATIFLFMSRGEITKAWQEYRTTTEA